MHTISCKASSPLDFDAVIASIAERYPGTQIVEVDWYAKPKGGLWFGPKPGSPEALAAKKAAKVKEPKAPRMKLKNDPKLIAAARELRDRYIEQINAGLLLPPSACGKYEVSRQLAPGAAPTELRQIPLLKAA